jgi:tRNA-specific 2-thiouridylase
MPHKAIALLSGGLDSTLAILVLLKQDIEVKAVRFRIPFDSDAACKGPDSYSSSAALRFRFEVEEFDLGQRFLDVVRDPKHGYGKNMNPCIDCRILMLGEARKIMDATGADFIVTGEVLGQRPMSQRKDMLYHIDKEAGVGNLVLRPLSAKLLRTTLPEVKGMVDREMLYDFSGRSRKPQMALAREFGLDDYPSPAGGCLLTEPNYASRLKDLLEYDTVPPMRDIALLRTGRHFRFSPHCKIIVGRDEDENAVIESLSAEGDCLLNVLEHGSPVTLVKGEITEEALRVAASLCVRYSDAKNAIKADVRAVSREDVFIFNVAPADSETIGSLRIGKIKTGKISEISKALPESPLISDILLLP